MFDVLLPYLAFARATVLSRTDLLVENAALRQQLEIYRRQTRSPRLLPSDRLFWIWLSRWWARWKSALVIVSPETVLRWHREGYRRHWRRISGGSPGRPPIDRDTIAVIQRISRDHPEWGEDRIALELELKLGITVSPSCVRRYLVRPDGPRPSNWSKFIASHAHGIFAMDMTTQYLWNYSTRYVLVLMAIDTRRIVHVAVTAHPTLDWIKQQIREATPYGLTPRFLLHDNDGVYGQFGRVKGKSKKRDGRRFRSALDHWLHGTMGIEGVSIPYGAPNANAFVERFFRTLKEECLNHFIFASEGHLRRTVREYVRYYNGARVHQGIRGIPEPAPGALARAPAREGPVRLESRPVLGGLIHDYRKAA